MVRSLGSWGSNSCTRLSQAERALQRERGSGECGITFAGCLAPVLFKSAVWNVSLSAKSSCPAVSFRGPFSFPLWFLSVAEFPAHELCRCFSLFLCSVNSFKDATCCVGKRPTGDGFFTLKKLQFDSEMDLFSVLCNTLSHHRSTQWLILLHKRTFCVYKTKMQDSWISYCQTKYSGPHSWSCKHSLDYLPFGKSKLNTNSL